MIQTISDFIFSSKIQLNRQTRVRALQLLLTLCQGNESNYNCALKMLYNFLAKIEKSWRFVDSEQFDSDIGLK